MEKELKTETVSFKLTKEEKEEVAKLSKKYTSGNISSLYAFALAEFKKNHGEVN